MYFLFVARSGGPESNRPIPMILRFGLSPFCTGALRPLRTVSFFFDAMISASPTALTAAAVTNLKLVAGVGGKHFGYVAESLGEGGGGEEGILALAQVGVVEINGEGEHVDGEGVSEGGLEVTGFGALIDFVAAAAIEGATAAFPRIVAGFAAHIGGGLRPDEIGEALRHADHVDELMADVDEEFEGEGEAVLHEAGGDEDALGAAEADVAVADGPVAEVDGVVGGNDGVVVIADGERHEVPGALAEGRGDDGGDSLHDALDFVGAGAHLAEDRVAEAVVGLADLGLLSHFGGGKQRDLRGSSHKLVF
jgi:hypothetical protein